MGKDHGGLGGERERRRQKAGEGIRREEAGETGSEEEERSQQVRARGKKEEG